MQTVILDNEEIKTNKIVCVGRNYVEHIKELGNEVPTSMVVFMKPNSSISSELKSGTDEKIHYEGEISFLIKDKRIIAVGFGLDLTKRELQGKLKAKGLPWERAKAFDGASVFSDFMTFKNDIDKLSLKLFINDTLTQEGGVESMMYKPNVILKEINSFSSLQDGDIVMSGTPKGVGIVNKGDKFLGQILYEENVLVQKEWMVK